MDSQPMLLLLLGVLLVIIIFLRIFGLEDRIKHLEHSDEEREE